MTSLDFSKKRFLIVGDIILDSYQFGTVNRISPEAPVPIFKYHGIRHVPGGAANVANNLISVDQDVSIMSVRGDDVHGNALCTILREKNINIENILIEPERPTTVKMRLLADNNQQVMRIDMEEVAPVEEATSRKLMGLFDSIADSYDAVLISDYAKGLLTPDLVKHIIASCNKLSIPVLIDPKERNIEKYKRCTLFKPNQKELQEITGMPVSTDEEATSAAMRLKEELKTEYLLVTRGSKGMLYIDSGNHVHHVPADTKEVYDVTGAGDTVLAYMGLCFAHGQRSVDAVKIANTAAAIKVGKIGTSVVTIGEMKMKMHDHGRKSLSWEQLGQRCDELRKQNSTIVFTNGCFDIIHAGHISYLKDAKALGDVLVLGLNSDQSVKRIKGEKRPILHEDQRITIMEELECIDYIAVFGEDTPYNLIKTVKPDILVKGGDYKPEDVVGKDIVESYGGRVKILPYVDGQSTTNIVNKIIDLYSDNKQH